MPRSQPHSPRTKRELRDKILSYGFSGDFRQLSPNPEQVRVRPLGSTGIGLDFPDTGTHYEIVVRRPRGEEEPVSRHAGTGRQQAPAAMQAAIKSAATAKRGRAGARRKSHASS